MSTLAIVDSWSIRYDVAEDRNYSRKGDGPWRPLYICGNDECPGDLNAYDHEGAGVGAPCPDCGKPLA